ncbi:putative deoxyribonuclease RhsC [Dyella sp. AD56]|uniref:hypothetical protein n=1 Tax=Dyella sp. AD56 TaxID=1528744 RepID=UPI000C82ADA0|nr:hypothetical protein [Dyella sp. AD56]PMQ04531.1 putative deoxyribonuclease RhsC [Dyella sp. AD56]
MPRLNKCLYVKVLWTAMLSAIPLAVAAMGTDAPRLPTTYVPAFYHVPSLTGGIVGSDGGNSGTHRPGAPIPAKDLEGVSVTASLYSPSNQASSNLDEQDKNGGRCSGNYVGMPIDVSKGTKLETYPLFSVPGEMALSYVLYYNTSPFHSWFSSFDYSLTTSALCQIGTQLSCTLVSRPDGSLLKFFGGPKSTTYSATAGSVATLTRDEGSGNYTLRDENATTQVYSSAGKILSVTNASGIGWTFSYNANGYRVTHTNGTFVDVINGPLVSTQAPGGGYYRSQVTTVKDPAGNAYVITRNNGSFANDEIKVASIALPGTPATLLSFKYALYTPGTNVIGNSLMTELDINGVPYSYTSYMDNASSPYHQWANGTYLADGSDFVSVLYGTDSQGHLTGVVTNPLGHNAKNTYAGINGQLTSVSNDAMASCGATVASRAYDNRGNLSQTIDNNGNVHTYSYAANGQLQTETEASGTAVARTTDYTWDQNAQLNRLLSVTIRGLRRTAYSYNEKNRLASIAVTNLTGNGNANQTLTTTYNYNLYGNGTVQSMTVVRPSPNGSDTTTVQYDNYGNLTSETNGLGQRTIYTNYNALGQVGYVQGPNGNVTEYTYDARGRIATQTTHPNGTTATWAYAYDGFGLPASITGPDGQVTTWTRDARMWVSRITHNDKDGTSNETFDYDASGNVLQRTVARGGAVGLMETFHYDALGRLYQKVGQSGQTLTYAYDGNGNPLSAANAMGHTIVYQYDALNRVTQQAESGGASLPIPPTIGSINLPGEVWAATGSVSNPYTVSWNSAPYATDYVLQEQADDGDWVTVQSGSNISWSASGKPKGVYSYRVQACDATGCSAWSPAGTFVVNGPNPELPAILQIVLDSP